MKTIFRIKGGVGFVFCFVFVFVRASDSCGKDINQDSEECIGLSPVQEVARLSAKKMEKGFQSHPIL